jgi:hypothetical protein
MGQSTSNLSGPNLESSSSATRTDHHRTRQHHQYGLSKRSIVSTSENNHLRGYVRSSHTRTSTYHDQTERARRPHGYRDQNLYPLQAVDGNARQITASSASKVQQRRKHAKPKEPKPPDDGRALKPRRNPNGKTEPQRREKTNDDGKPQSHAHSTPSSSNNQRHDSKDKSGAIVNITELNPKKPKRKPKSEKRETKDCMVCVETRSVRHFPQRAITAQCTHEVNTCRHCLRGWIRSEFKSKVWNQLACPECRASMEYEDVKEFAPPEVFRR